MRLSSFVNLGLIAAGAAASVRTLLDRHRWEQSNRRAFIVLDYDDALAVCTRAGLELPEFLRDAHHHGATHLSLPELTLSRLIEKGRLVPTVVAPGAQPRPAGRWHTLASGEPALLEHVLRELSARVPASRPHRVAEADVPVIALAGDWPTLAEMGLGFEAEAAAAALAAGLGVVPQPVGFAWPEGRLVERSLLQAAGLQTTPNDPIILAFEGDIILGHEMHLGATVDCMLRHRLYFAYFSETRHQKGDWFIAKRLASTGQVIPAHAFTPAAMVPEDFHSAAHHWGMLARSRGIRLCYVNVFRRIHATEPLDCLRYLEHIKGELEGLGLQLGSGTPGARPLAAPQCRTLAAAALAPAGAAALAASRTLALPEPAALAVSAASVAGAIALPYLDRPRGHLEEAYPPSYAPKLLALAGAAAAPAAAALAEDGLAGAAEAALIQAALAASLAAFTTGQDYALRIEQFRSLDLDWAMPLAAVLLRAGQGRGQWAALAGLAAAWGLARARTPDVLGQLDRDLPAGHTHHLSAAQRVLGDSLMALGPRPGRKWSGLGLAGLAAAGWLRGAGQRNLGLAAALVGAFANAMTLAAFRQPERPLAQTVEGAGRSWARWGLVTAGLLAAAGLLRPVPGDRRRPPAGA
ncbi:MAG: hypothetical protein IT318_03075 [Anaerolineales bacterium]|nr:hypothetical protein [Anaerolineales bacterium]